MKENQETVLVTGASNGIGYELAKKFAENGYNLILVSRNQTRLEEIATLFNTQYGVEVNVISKDLFEMNAANELYDEVKSRGLEVDILVNDAGQGVYGMFAETDLAAQIKIIQLNIISLITLTQLFLKDMLQKNKGKILQLASVVSELPSPLQAVYGGTKAFVLSFTESVISEIKESNVTITALQPGVTDTDFFAKAGAQNSKLTQDKSKMSNPADVAADGYDALMKGDDKVVSGFKNKVQVAMANVMPDTMLAEQLKKQSGPADE